MNPIMIDETKCVGCSLCVRDCPNSYLCLEKGKAHTRDSGCIECGHCYAICPQGAVSMANYDCKEEIAIPMTDLDSSTLLQAMRSRRTIRQFTEQKVEREKIEKILEAGRYSPTGANAQNVAFTILGGKQAEAEALCVKLFRKGKKLGSGLVPFLKRIDITDSFFFKGAPLVIVVSSKSNVNAGLASAYMEIMAESLGLGVLYSGFFAICAKISGKLRRLIQLPKGHKVVSCMIIGYPAVKYRRIVPRKEVNTRTL